MKNIEKYIKLKNILYIRLISNINLNNISLINPLRP